MSWEPVGFMFFSTIETLALYYLIMSLFRFKWKWYLWQVLFVILLNNLQSYLLRNELGMANISPLILILIFILFFSAVVRMPLILSIIATISGYVIFAVIQTIIVLLVFGSISDIYASVGNGYFLQLLTSAVVFFIFSYAYRKGKGFTFDLDKLRLKLEDILLSVLILGFVIGISVLLYYNDILLNAVIFVIMSVFLLYYSTRKEKEDA
ncbi:MULTISPECIES: hypothetical protein [Paenibacillus]|uniref:Uncharacterized protein n=1 Tax=Paenibacillus phytohabitans TaxID=2654978 RepID=A0ABX1YBR4_9BACL|nr:MULTISPECIES: hypothetical protein [Paenibacillus]NOU78407.1 hypothetical protein [Paenibacillus phytohabitans]